MIKYVLIKIIELKSFCIKNNFEVNANRFKKKIFTLYQVNFFQLISPCKLQDL